MADSNPDDEAQQHLFCLLRDAEAGDDAPLREYLDTSPRQKTDDLLYAIANRATPTHQYALFWVGMLLIMVMFFCIVSDLLHGKSLWESISSFVLQFFNSFWIFAGWHSWSYRKGRAALLHLADRDDLRALPLLLTEGQPPYLLRRGWNNRVAASLARLLDEGPCEDMPLATQEKLQKIVNRFVAVIPFWLRLGATPSDLSPTNAYLAVAILRRLHQAGGPDNQDLVALVAANARVLPPHRAFVCDAAQALLSTNEALAVIPSAAQPALAAAPVVHSPGTVQTLRRP